jgi:hypothetical protein
MIKRIKCVLAAFLCLSTILPVFACASDAKKVPSCENNSMIYFDCISGDQRFVLCERDSKALQFISYKNDLMKDHFTGITGKEFKFSNYHRYKVNQNTVSFKSKLANYEVFEYSDEESTPKIEEYGIIITPLKNNQSINLVCKGQVTSNISKLAD